MSEKKFMELLNLYLDREIDAEDALRLEAEVASNPRRRRLYDQYCRIQKACSMLTGAPASGSVDTRDVVTAFPAPSFWGQAPLLASLALAACLLVAVGIRERAAAGARDPLDPAVAPARALAATVDQPASPDAMTAVFLARPASPAQQGAAQFTALESPSQDAELGWIGGVHMAPMFPAPNSQLIADPKSGAGAPGLVDPQTGRAVQEPVEMTAFRFQR
jgi:hypothetical protein